MNSERIKLSDILFENRVGDMAEYLRQGGNVNFIIHDETTLLSNATSVEMATLLVEAGADIHHRGTEGKTPLIWQAGDSHYSILSYLLSLDPELIRDVDDTGETALHRCVRHAYENSLKCAEVLLAANPPVDINYVNNKGLTALDLAVRSSNVATERIIKLLLENGANPELVPGYERFPYGKTSAKIVKQFVSNRRNKTMYAQAYRGLADRIPENTAGVVKGFLEGPTAGPHRFPSRNTRKSRKAKSRKSRKGKSRKARI
jgi:ankyrin repeat protein